MPDNPEVSVIIATYNGHSVLPEQLESLAGQVGDVAFEVIVADNGSTDGTVQAAEAFTSRLRLRILDASSRPGQGFARNLGAGEARADKLIFVDQDDVVSSNYVAVMSRALDEHAMVGARIDHETLNPGWVSASRRPAQVASLGSALGFLSYAGGQTLGVRRAVFEQVSGFDPNMPGAVEDVDLCWRVQLAGGDLSYAPDAVVQYRYRSTLRAQLRQAYGYGQAEATLYHRYRPMGMQRRRTGRAAKEWLIWGRSILRARSKADLAKVGWKLAHDVGMVRTSIRLRTFYP